VKDTYVIQNIDKGYALECPQLRACLDKIESVGEREISRIVKVSGVLKICPQEVQMANIFNKWT